MLNFFDRNQVKLAVSMYLIVYIGLGIVNIFLLNYQKNLHNCILNLFFKATFYRVEYLPNNLSFLELC
jgi:hypothetical protein